MLKKKNNRKVIKTLNLDYHVVAAIKKLATKESRNFSNFVNLALTTLVKKEARK